MKLLTHVLNYLTLCAATACALVILAIVTHYGVTIVYGRDLLAAYQSTKAFIGIAIGCLWFLVFLRAWLFSTK